MNKVRISLVKIQALQIITSMYHTSSTVSSFLTIEKPFFANVPKVTYDEKQNEKRRSDSKEPYSISF